MKLRDDPSLHIVKPLLCTKCGAPLSSPLAVSNHRRVCPNRDR